MVLNTIINTQKEVKQEIIYREVPVETKSVTDGEETQAKKISVTLEDVKSKWNDILKMAKDEKPYIQRFSSRCFSYEVTR